MSFVWGKKSKVPVGSTTPSQCVLFAHSHDGEQQYAEKNSISFQTSGGDNGISFEGKGKITPGTVNEFHHYSLFPSFLV